MALHQLTPQFGKTIRYHARPDLFVATTVAHAQDGKALGVSAMSKRYALILAFGALLVSFGAQASPIVFAPMQKAI
jgi:hypothetical protein